MWKWVLAIVGAAVVVLAATSWVLWQRWNRDPLSEMPGYLHEGAAAIAVSPDGRWVVTRDEDGGIRAYDTGSGAVRILPTRPPGRGGLEATGLAFTSDGILLGVPWSREAPDGFLGLRAGTWEEVVVPAAPRRKLWDVESDAEVRARLANAARQAGAKGIDAPKSAPPGPLRVPAAALPMPEGGNVLGLVQESDACALTVWTAATGTVVRNLDVEWTLADPEAVLPSGDAVVLRLHWMVSLRDLRDGKVLWRADPFETGKLTDDPDETKIVMDRASAGESGGDGHIFHYELIGVGRDGRRVVCTQSQIPSAALRFAQGGAAPTLAELTAHRLRVAVLDAATGETVWNRTSGATSKEAFLGPGRRSVLLVEDGHPRLLDLEDGRDVTPAGWPGVRMLIRAAAPDPDDHTVWVVLRDGRVRRLEVPPADR